MLARLDEFESLTPLMITPGSVDDATSRPLRMFGSASQSPPPPRRTPTGKTLIVPLATNKGRAPLVPLLGTPDSRVTSFDNGTSKSFATIPEDDENVHSPSDTDRLDADLISIDRTSISFVDSRTLRYHCRSGLSVPTVAPEFEIPTPSYAPPPPPPDAYRPSLFVRSPKSISRREFTNVDNGSIPNSSNTRTKKSPSGDSINSFSSPPESSFGTGSPLDTSGSISDSFYLASESEVNTDAKAKLYLSDSGIQQRIGSDGSAATSELELSAIDADAQSQRKYFLHRIEEESEHLDEAVGVPTSRTFDSIASELSCISHVDSERNILIPRSISQQFELMNRK
ncbi:unnamed protein product [Toxocara canis]|uniref:Uncharacterized protein n=1 Tax=Toxocara canis TaxID=6265 RepID=A0A183V2T4_TOXCA|nr:unnamed protein product [Toxocara canis]